METLQAHIKKVTDKVQDLIRSNSTLLKENEKLKKELLALHEEAKSNKEFIFDLNQKITILKASTGSLTEGDRKEFEKKVDRYIKEIDKCIGILSE